MADKLISSKLIEKQDKGSEYLLVYENVFQKPTGETYTKKSYTWVSKKSYKKHPKWYGGKKNEKKKSSTKTETTNGGEETSPVGSLPSSKDITSRLASIGAGLGGSAQAQWLASKVLSQTPEGELAMVRAQIEDVQKKSWENVKRGISILKELNQYGETPQVQKAREQIKKSITQNLATWFKARREKMVIGLEERQIKQLRRQGYEFKKAEKSWIPYKPLTKEQKRVLISYKLAGKQSDVDFMRYFASLTTPVGVSTAMGLTLSSKLLGTGNRVIRQMEKEVEREYRSMERPSFEALKNIYYAQAPKTFRLASSFGWSFIKTGAGILTFPEFIAEEGFGRLYTWAKTGKPRRVELIPASEWIGEKIHFYTPPSLTPGAIEATISSVVGWSPKPFEKMAKHPWEAVAGTFGELSAFWLSGKIARATKNYAKSLIRVKIEPIKTWRGWKIRYRPTLKGGVSLKEIEKWSFKKFRYPAVVKAEDYYFFGRAKGLPVEWGKYAKSGYAILKPGKKVGMATMETIKKMSAPYKEIVDVWWIKPTEFELPATIKGGKGIIGFKGFESTGVKGFIFRRATIRRGLIIKAFEFEKPSLGGVSRYSPVMPVSENITRKVFENLARRVAFPIRTPPISAISLGGFSVASMERLTRIKPTSYKVKPIGFTMPKFKVETISAPAVNFMRDFNRDTDINRIVFPGVRSGEIKIPAIGTGSGQDFIRDIERAQESMTRSVEAEMPVYGYKFAIPRFAFPTFEERPKKKRRREIIIPEIDIKSFYKEFRHPVGWLFR